MTKFNVSQQQPVIEYCLPIRAFIGKNTIISVIFRVRLTNVSFAFCHSVASILVSNAA